MFLGIAIYSVTVGQGYPFDMQAFGIGIGATLTAGGASLGFKAKTEPKGGA